MLTLRNDLIPFLLAAILLLVGLIYLPVVIDSVSARLATATQITGRERR